VFAETNSAACRAIRQNLETLGLTGALVLQRDAVSVLREERTAGRRHELILLDPPYETWEALEPVLAGLLPDVVSDDGLVVVETDGRSEPQLPLDLVTARRYGSARLTLFAK
jgi:16S rRNA G966 N2-methylase RsmD